MKIFRIAVFAVLVCVASTKAFSEAFNWELYRSEQFGYSLFFPTDVLSRGVVLRGVTVLSSSLVTAERSSRFLQRTTQTTLGSPNIGKLSCASLLAMTILYMARRVRAGSFFLARRGGSIYYQKVMLSCGGRVINAFALTYPREQKREYDDIVTGIEKSFRPSWGPACSARD